MAFTSSIAALTPPTTIAQFKTALDADLTALEAYTVLGFTSQVLALPAIHSPTQFKNALVADLAAIDTAMLLTSIGLDGREKWSELLYQLSLWGQGVADRTITLLSASGAAYQATTLFVDSAGAQYGCTNEVLNSAGNSLTLV